MRAGAAVLALTFALFGFGWIGGGDAKLAAATALWLGFDTLMEYFLVASIAGGGLTLAILALRKLPLPAIALRWDWLSRLHHPEDRRSLRHRARARGARRLSAHGDLGRDRRAVIGAPLSAANE